MKSDEKLWEICMDIYREMYKKSEPSADFDELIESGETKKPMWFMNYELEEDKASQIVQKHFEKNKLRKFERRKVSMEVFLGCAPKTKNA